MDIAIATRHDPQERSASDPASGSGSLVLVEDEPALRDGLVFAARSAGFSVQAFADGATALRCVQETLPDIVLTDLRLPKSSGLDVLFECRRTDPDLPVVVMTGHADVPTAIQAIRSGAYEFMEKPFTRDRLVSVLRQAGEHRRLALENKRLKSLLASASGLARALAGGSEAMRELRETISLVAPKPADVIVLGETGTGKELVARCIHDHSGREGCFVAINCAAIPETLFESELFGHEAGAYTSASKQRVGKLEYAHGGTVFLDEIEAMPLQLQAKLLRALQERSIERLGSNRVISVDIRVIAATKTDLRQLSMEGRFREDLYYRLNVVNLSIPPLRQRVEDIPLLFKRFIEEAAKRYQQDPLPMSREVLQQLLAHAWPGNVRELRHAAERFQMGLPLAIGAAAVAADGAPALPERLAALEKAFIEDAIARTRGSIRDAAEELGLLPATLYRKLNAYALDPMKYRI